METLAWTSVDEHQPDTERIVLVFGFFKNRPFTSLGKYTTENNWWHVIAQTEDIILIESTDKEIDNKPTVKVRFWMNLPEAPHAYDV